MVLGTTSVGTASRLVLTSAKLVKDQALILLDPVVR